MELSRGQRFFTTVIANGLALALLLFVVSKHFPPSGELTVDLPFDGTSIWFYPFLPGERAQFITDSRTGEIIQRITSEPVYSTLRLPGPYREADISLEIKPTNVSLIELGILRDLKTFSFEYSPLFSKELSSGWREVEHGGTHGFVSEQGTTSSILLTDPTRILTWKATSTQLALTDTVPLARDLEVNIRGSHDFWIVPVNGIIDMTFAVQDVNRSRLETATNAAFVLSHQDMIVATESVALSASHDQKQTSIVQKRFYRTDLPAGVYRLRFMADDDFFLRRITSINRRWIVGTSLYSGDTAGYVSSSVMQTWYTNAQHLSAEIRHQTAKQTVRFGEATEVLQTTHQAYPLNRTASDAQSPWVVLNYDQGNVRLVSDGYFAPDVQALFLPEPRKLTAETRLIDEGIDAVLTPHVQSESLGDGWFRVRTKLQLPPTSEPQRIALSAPLLSHYLGSIDIRRATVTFKRDPLTLKSFFTTLRGELSRVKKHLLSL